MSSVAFGGGGEPEDRVDVEDSAPLALERPDEQSAPDAVTTHRLVRAPMQAAPPVRRGPVPLACSDRIDAAAERATMPMVA
jgi:hypothetical protein